MLKVNFPKKIEESLYAIRPKYIGFNFTIMSMAGKIEANSADKITKANDIKYLLPEELQKSMLDGGSCAIFGTVTLDNRYKAKVYIENSLTPHAESLEYFIKKTLVNGHEDKNYKYLQFIPHSVHAHSRENFITFQSHMDYLMELGFDVGAQCIETNPTPEQLAEIFQQWRQMHSIDGLVLLRSGMYLTHFQETAIHYNFPPFVYTSNVQDIMWVTQPNGNIEPYIQLEPSIDLKTETDVTRIHSAKGFHLGFLKESQIGIGSQVDVIVPEDYKAFIYKGKTKNVVEPPLECPSCEHPTFVKNNHLRCSHFECVSKSRAPIYTLCKENSNINLHLVEKWLDHFPIRDKHYADIRGVIDFKTLFKQSGPKSVAMRYNLLVEHHGQEQGKKLWELENSIEPLLNKLEEYQ